jgi:hypothetical protein
MYNKEGDLLRKSIAAILLASYFSSCFVQLSLTEYGVVIPKLHNVTTKGKGVILHIYVAKQT